jgi:methylase of polypeptide subunit release factors
VETFTQEIIMNNLYFSTQGPRNFKVFYEPGMDGGGTWFGQEYISVIPERYPRRIFENCLEWCAGPGYIGYSILDHGLCNHLSLVEIHTPTAQQAQRTKEDSSNQCDSQVTIYNTGDISQLPENAKFDLIVGNPPHFFHASTDPTSSRIESDPGWQVHQNFFANIAQHLTRDGVILLQENMLETTVDTFSPYIESAGLKVTDWFQSPKWFGYPKDSCLIYYIEIMHQ